MLRDLKLFGRTPARIPPPEPNNENLDPEADPSRPPLHAIQDPISRQKTPFRTPEKPAAAARGKFGWGGSATSAVDGGEESCNQQHPLHLPPRGGGSGYTPRTYRMGGKASSVHSESSSTQSTPTKSVTKPVCSGFGGYRPPASAGARAACFSAASRGMPMVATPPTVVTLVEVPHFELKEDPSFWLDHNVQVVIRVRPLSTTEQNVQGYSRCLKQESAQCVSWIGQPETRFTFDYVACETINQEMLFRVTGLPMVENCMSGYNCCMFAYGQTGSGKTYTMLGEIDNLEIKPSTDRGMTPRIFEFLFARIRAEEESRRDEKLKYSCKCSFLEIYNEQITDLLDPSSTNLLLREDLRKGVYVENLSEFEVETVNDILKLLIQGAANRKVAATNMNRESSRSHSVFTCVIESRWEKDSTTNLRFARLNLVDLAGSERQKTSGAEGDRLKEAANINKSLSTLGHVIMILADVAHGKQRHIPYRDSRLTFLLQDSLGGNSKTIIMANVTPSICSANETLSTLKFAQRAKLIQNNAVVNEDTSGDIIALQHQIRLLKEELAVLKHQNITRSLSFRTSILEDSEQESFEVSASKKLCERVQMNDNEFGENEASSSVRISTKQLKSLEATLSGAIRREKMADITIKQLEAEIEQLNCLVRQREEDAQCSKMKLKFREDKIHRMESLVDGRVATDTYLIEENSALSEEIQLLQTRVDRNPEVTRFALENIKLLDQLRRFQDFYEEGERELLLTEVSELRNQLIQCLDAKSEQDQHPKADMVSQLKRTCQELEDCKKNLKSCLETNARLTREINDLRIELNNIQSSSHDQHVNIESQILEFCLPPSNKDSQVQAVKVESESPINHAEEILDLQLELDILKTILVEEKSSHFEVEERVINKNHELEVANQTIAQLSKLKEDLADDLKNSKSLIEALESQHVISLNELEDLRVCNDKYADLLKKQEQDISILRNQLGVRFEGEGRPTFANEGPKDQSLDDSPLQLKLKRMQASVEKVCRLNMRYQSDQASQTLIEQEMDEVRSQVETETAEVIVCLQEELMSLQQQISVSNNNEFLAKQRLSVLEIEIKEIHERLCSVTHENGRLAELLEKKEMELKLLTEDWDRLAHEIADVLANGNASLEDASDHISSLSDSFPQRICISEKVGRIVRSISERDALIEELQKSLEDAQNIRCDMEWKLRSLRGATLAITEAQQQETSEKEREILFLTSQLSKRDEAITELESRIKHGDEQIRRAEICATVAFMTVNRLSEINRAHLLALENVTLKLNESEEKSFQKDALLQHQISLHTDAASQIQSMQLQLEQSQEHMVQLKHVQEQERSHALENKLRKEEEDAALSKIVDDVLKTKRVVNEIKSGVCTTTSCMSEYIEQVSEAESVQNSRNDCIERTTHNSEHPKDIKSIHNVASYKQDNVQSDLGGSIDNPGNIAHCSECSKSSKDSFERETIIFLLQKEIESALDNLKDIRDQMLKLLSEREQMKISETQYRKNMERLSVEVLRLKSDTMDKELQFDCRLIELEHKLQTVEGNAVASSECWRKAKEAKEVFELEISDVKSVAAQKTDEASSLLKKIEEAQETMRDADIMINALVEANESMKLEIERCQNRETLLSTENKCLIDEVKALEFSLDRKEQECERMWKSFQLTLTEAQSLVLTLEDGFSHIEASCTEKFKLIDYDLDRLKYQFQQYAELARTWLEDTWLDIIGKDCAVSVLHHCHMGILLERITGLNAENGFLYHGLCESNSVIADLREHNVKAKKDLEMCSLLKGKLLLDINKNFNRIAKKEDETDEFKDKLNSFEKKIVFFQSQEESMLARSNSMGAELAILMKELDSANRKSLTAVSVKEKLFSENDELHKQLNETYQLLEEEKGIHEMYRNLVCEELNLLSVKSSADPIAKIDSEFHNMRMRKEPEFYQKVLESQIECIWRNTMAKDFELLILESELKHKIVENSDMTLHIVGLGRRIGTFNEVFEKMKGDIILRQIDIELKNTEVCCLLVDNEKMKTELLKLKEDNSRTTDDLHEAKIGLASWKNKNVKLQETIVSLEACITSLQTEVERKRAELKEIQCSHTVISKEFDLRNTVAEIQVERINTLEAEKDYLRKEVAVISKELDLKNEVTKAQIERINALELENNSLTNEADTLKQRKNEILTMFKFKLEHLFNRAHTVEVTLERLFQITDERIARLMDTQCQENLELKETTSKVFDELDSLASFVKELMSEKFSLQSELVRKDEMLKGLLFDLSLLQESASVTKDQKDQSDEMAATLESLEDELASKICELDEAVAHGQTCEAELADKNERISSLELEIAEKYDKLNHVSSENLELKAYIKHIVEMKNTFEQELKENNKVTERLENEILAMNTLLGQRNACMQDFQNDMIKLVDERDNLDSMIVILKDQLEMAQALAEENEAIATEARQIAEGRKVYAENKEEEVRLLERSVEELEYTVNALENKVEVVREEAERQWLQREELQMELETVRNQMLIAPDFINASDVAEGGEIYTSRSHKDQATELQEVQQTIQFFQKEVADKDAEIIQCKAHISELNMHAEAQAREYKQKVHKPLYQSPAVSKKFMELEEMARQVKMDLIPSNAMNPTSNKAEKSAAKTRGSGSPFKCIGLGMTLQINSEKDEELTAARSQIEELEAIVASRQKEIFMLNSRLAAAESMTHDVIRDLLGVKLDMANYATLLDHQQTKKENETTRFESQEFQEKEKEMSKVKKQLNEFIEERQSWLDEISERQNEVMAARILSEKLRQQEQFLNAENEILKADTAKYKNIVMELEDKVKRLSSQQNLQQRIHHHAKIKEENRSLKIQNEELSAKLQHSETILSRVKEELANYRASRGKKPYPDIDEEEHLRKKLCETEEERIQLAQKLVALCTYILKVAGISHQATSINPTAAEDALDQIEDRMNALESEVQNLKLQCRISCEKIRLSEFKHRRFSSSDEEYSSPNTSQSPCGFS